MAAPNVPVSATHPDVSHDEASENTPLLQHNEASASAQNRPPNETSAHDSLENIPSDDASKPRSRRRWPSIAALLFLCVAIILIIVFAFISPSVVEEYAKQAIKLDLTSVSIDSFTSTGVRARIQGEFGLEADRVRSKPVRDLGRFYTWIAREAETGESDVDVMLPEYGNVLLGTAHVPKIKVDLRNGHTTPVDFLADLEPGDVTGIKSIAKDWLDGRLGDMRVLAKAKVAVKSGIISVGKQDLQHEIVISGNELPKIPEYQIKSLLFRDFEKGMAVDASASVYNEYPIDFVVPPLGFTLLVENCKKTDPIIKLAVAETKPIHVLPKEKVLVNATGVVRQLPDVLLRDCPGTDQSPLDVILGRYINGKDNTIYVRGSALPDKNTPKWIGDIMSDFTVPLPLPGRSVGHLIKNFTLADSKFRLPDPWAEPDTPQANPRISAKVMAIVSLPEEMNFNLSVASVRADADVFYRGKKFGELDLHRWQDASSRRLENDESGSPTLAVESLIKDAPLYITNEDVFTQIIRRLVFEGQRVDMHIKANVDIKVATALGELTIRKIPAEGEVPISPINPGTPGKNGPGGIGSSFKPRVSDLQIENTTSSGLVISALVNITNPTPYAATIPYVDINILKNGSLLGHATIRDMSIVPGKNDRLRVVAVYDPLTSGGEKAARVGRELVSQYISGYNTSITIQTHRGTIPSLPRLGEAFSEFSFDIPTPHLGKSQPNNGTTGEEDGPHFIEDAMMHLFSSTATFTLRSPLKHTTLVIEMINATALYNDTYGDITDVGHIFYETPFSVPPLNKDGEGVMTPRLPVEWSLGSVGYDAVRNAIGGKLKVGAFAYVTVRIGRWKDTIWFRGKCIGAKIRL